MTKSDAPERPQSPSGDPRDPDARVVVSPGLFLFGLLCLLVGIGAGWVMSTKTFFD